MVQTYANTFCGPYESCGSHTCVLWPCKPRHHVTVNGTLALKPVKDFGVGVTNRNTCVTAPEKESILRKSQTSPP